MKSCFAVHGCGWGIWFKSYSEHGIKHRRIMPYLPHANLKLKISLIIKQQQIALLANHSLFFCLHERLDRAGCTQTPVVDAGCTWTPVGCNQHFTEFTDGCCSHYSWAWSQFERIWTLRSHDENGNANAKQKSVLNAYAHHGKLALSPAETTVFRMFWRCGKTWLTCRRKADRYDRIFGQ